MANGDYIKVYIYCMFLCKHNSEISPLDLSKKLCLPLKTVELALKYWEEQDVIIKKQNTYILSDLKKLEVDKLYKPKVTSSLEDALDTNSKNVLRTQAINEINSVFFQGVMSPTWYTDIDTLFVKYQFDEDVVISLFRYCFDRQALHKKYLFTVAEAWHSNNIRNVNDLEKYYLQYEKSNQMKKTICKKLGITRKLSQYEEAYVDRWTIDYNYPIDIIELALKKTTSKANPSFDYIDKIITDWHEKKLVTADEIQAYSKEQKEKYKTVKEVAKTITPKYTDGETNQYNDLSKFYANI